jgi:hypothetical protein
VIACTTPTDGNPPAPIIRAQRPMGRRERSPDEWKTTTFRDWHDNRHGDREKRVERRAVHSGQLSHDDDGRTA